MIIRCIEGLTNAVGVIAAWAFFAVGVMIGVEVVARYIFNAPTTWAEEMSRFLQIWATYLAAAYVLKNRDMIRVGLIDERVGTAARRALDLFALAVIAVFAAVAIVFGIEIVADSVHFGRRTSTMMAVPLWMTESAIPIGGGLLLVQTAVEARKVVTGRPASGGSFHGGRPESEDESA